MLQVGPNFGQITKKTDSDEWLNKFREKFLSLSRTRDLMVIVCLTHLHFGKFILNLWIREKEGIVRGQT